MNQTPEIVASEPLFQVYTCNLCRVHVTDPCKPHECTVRGGFTPVKLTAAQYCQSFGHDWEELGRTNVRTEARPDIAWTRETTYDANCRCRRCRTMELRKGLQKSEPML